MPRTLLLVALLLAVAPAVAVDISSEAKEVEDCMRRNLPKESSVQTVTLKRTARDGAAKKLRATIWWKKGEDGLHRARLSFDEPDDIRGSGLLVLQTAGGGNELFMYLPELRRVRRVTGHMMSGSMFGTDFTYEQIERLQGLANDARIVRRGDAVEDGVPVYVIEATPAPTADGPSELTRVVTFVATETCVPVKMEFYGDGASPTHVMVADRERITKEPTGYVPRRVVMRDPKKGTETELQVEKIEIGVDLPARHFSQTALEIGGR